MPVILDLVRKRIIKMVNNHYHPPRCKNALCISDEWIEYISRTIVRRAEQKILAPNLRLVTVRAVWHGTVLAESERTELVDGRYYFPPESVNKEYLQESSTRTLCLRKGTASYYNIEVGGEINRNGAWYYPEPKEWVRHIKGYITFAESIEIINKYKTFPYFAGN
jgi:uncharacterized protein (DUF427 family)